MQNKFLNFTLSQWKLLISFTIVSLFFSCNSIMDNPLMNFKIGESEKKWKREIKQNLSNKRLKEINPEKHIYGYNFKKGSELIPSNVWFNLDGYNSGKLRTIGFTFPSDSELKQDRISPLRFDSAVLNTNKDNALKVLDWFIELYGMPTDTFNSNPEGWLWYDNQFQVVFNAYTRNGTLIWDFEDYTLEFFKNERDLAGMEIFEASIIYKIKSLDKEIKEITEPLRIKYTPNDIMKINSIYPNWRVYENIYGNLDYDLTIAVEGFKRFHKEEYRKIAKIKFAVVLQDSFNEEIHRIEDFIYEFREPFKFVLEGKKNPNDDIGAISYEITYSSNANNFEKLERARLLAKRGELKCQAEIVAIVFEDGEILNK